MANSFMIEGVAELSRKLEKLGSPKQQAATLRAAVRVPMRLVMRHAKVNLQKISPGKRPIHKTYLGRLVTSGFAQRSVRMIVKMNKEKTMAQAILGVRKEAFYVLQFFELGTATIARQPWLMPAFYQSKDEQIKRLGEVMKDRIERIARERGG